MTIYISAVICTHNRSAYLKKAIQSLVDQTLPKEQYEIIIVDNGSTDNTKAVVDGFKHLGNMRYIYEPILGLSQARNTGWQNAQGKYIAYMDDDAIACPEWLDLIVTAFETVVPQPGSVGGKVMPIWEIGRPKWLSKALEPLLTIIDWAAEPIFLEENQCLVGTNVAYPKEVLKKIGGFSINLGRKGKKLLSGEEILMRNLLKRQGLREYYDPRIKVQHHIAAERLTKQWFYRRYFWHGVSSEILRNPHRNEQKTIGVTHLREECLIYLRLARSLVLLVISLLLFLSTLNADKRMLYKCYIYSYWGQILACTKYKSGWS